MKIQIWVMKILITCDHLNHPASEFFSLVDVISQPHVKNIFPRHRGIRQREVCIFIDLWLLAAPRSLTKTHFGRQCKHILQQWEAEEEVFVTHIWACDYYFYFLTRQLYQLTQAKIGENRFEGKVNGIKSLGCQITSFKVQESKIPYRKRNCNSH